MSQDATQPADDDLDDVRERVRELMDEERELFDALDQ